MSNNRIKTKRLLVIRTRSHCQWCKKESDSLHLHELINRDRTLKGSDAREASYAAELCSLLCPKCHEEAHNPDRRYELIAINKELYGEERVNSAWELFLEANGYDNAGIKW